MLANDLRHRVEVYMPKLQENELNESEQIYEKVKSVYASVLPKSGKRNDADSYGGDVQSAEVTHEFTIRRCAIPMLSIETKLKLDGCFFDVLFFFPQYKHLDRIIVSCRQTQGKVMLS